jgi:hypothetical protein
MLRAGTRRSIQGTLRSDLSPIGSASWVRRVLHTGGAKMAGGNAIFHPFHPKEPCDLTCPQSGSASRV